MSSNDISIVTTCMGRLSFLQRTLRSWLNFTNCDIIIVDYSCPNKCSEWISSLKLKDRLKALPVTAHQISGVDVFNVSRARNHGASVSDSQYLLFVDSDIELNANFYAWCQPFLAKDVFLSIPYSIMNRSDTGGLLLVHKDAFIHSGKYSEEIVGWGGECQDILVRLFLHGYKHVPIPLSMINVIEHSNELRTQFQIDKDPYLSMAKNMRLFNKRYRQTTGKTFEMWMKAPGVKKILFNSKA